MGSVMLKRFFRPMGFIGSTVWNGLAGRINTLKDQVGGFCFCEIFSSFLVV